jgi:hypothetical protein
MNNNYMQQIAGHCYICHQDWNGPSHICAGSASQCNDNCFRTSKYLQKPTGNFCPNCGYKLQPLTY